jgi:hypothetical protein
MVKSLRVFSGLITTGSITTGYTNKIEMVVNRVQYRETYKTKCSRQCQFQEQTHMPRQVLWFIFNLQIKKLG